MVQIATESGLMPKAVRRNAVLLAPAERAEVIVDLTSFAGKSDYVRRPFTAAAVRTLQRGIDARQGSPHGSGSVILDAYGGAIARVDPDATAFVHREERFQLKHAVTLEVGASPEGSGAAHAQVTRSWGSVHPWGSGRVFQNFADPDLEDWPDAYYGPNLERLMRVKERYDPEDLFRSEQTLGALG